MCAKRLVIISYGFVAKQFHCKLIRSSQCGIVLHGIMVRSEASKEDVRRDFGGDFRIYDFLEDVLQDKAVDVVLVASPPNTHFDIALRLLQSRKHTVVEKPLTLTLAECDQLIQTAKDNDVLLTAFHNRRFDGDFQTVNQLIKSNQLARVRWVEIAYQKAGISSKMWKNESINSGGGRFYDLGVHCVDQLLALFPQPIQSVYCRLHFDFPTAPNIDSHAMIVVTFVDGVTGIVDCSSTTLAEKPHFYIVGETGTFVKYGFDPQEDALVKGIDLNNLDYLQKESEKYNGKIYRANGVQETVPTLLGRWLDFYDNLGDVLHGRKKELFIQPESLRKTMAVMDAALRSARTNQVINFE